MTRTRTRKQLNASLVLLLWLAISAGLSARAEAHVGDRVFPIAYLSDEMLEQIRLDDGRIDEWYELVGEPSMTLLDFKEEWEEDLEPDPSDLDFRVWLAWHDEPARIYVAFVAGDDVYKNTHDYSGGDWFGSSRDNMMDNDSIMLGFDGDHSGGAGCTSSCSQEDWPEAHGQTQWYEAIARTVGGPTLDDPGVRHRTEEFPWTVFPPYGDGGGGVAGENPTISVIELYVTPFDHWGGGWDSAGDHLVSDLAAWKVIGFAIIVHDRDQPGRWRGWAPEAMQRLDGIAIGELWDRRGDSFLDGLLLPPEPGDSAVESVSWGRIKAALEME